MAESERDEIAARRHAAGERALKEAAARHAAEATTRPIAQPTELGGRKGPEPTRFGDWEKKGRCSDF